jgi:Protein of unknown function (DUF4232)
MKTSDMDRKPRRAALLHPRPRHLALAAAVYPVVLASACASQAPPRAAASAQPPAAAAAPAHTAGTSSSPPAGGAPSPVARCQEHNLAAGVSRYNVGGGQRGILITLTNAGTASCSMYGYPGLGLQDSAHHVLPAQTHWGATYFAHDPGPSLIVLTPGQAASASVALSEDTQHTPWATYLEVTPPGGYRHLLITLSYGTGSTSGDLHVTAMARLTTIYQGDPGGCGCAAHPQQRQLAVTTLSRFKVVLTATRSPGTRPGPAATVTAAGYRHTPRGWKLIAAKRIGKASGWSWYATEVCSLTVTQLKPEPSSAVPSDTITVRLLWGPAIGCLGPYTERWRP